MRHLIILCSACGVGKSTVCEYFQSHPLQNYACIDTDEVGINWWDYASTDHASRFNDDCIAKANELAKGKNLLFVTCMNPYDFYGKVTIPESFDATYFIAMTCSDAEIAKRLRARPKERMCSSDEFIQGQIDYNRYFKQNRNKFQYAIDNTGLSVTETAEKIADYIRNFTS